MMTNETKQSIENPSSEIIASSTVQYVDKILSTYEISNIEEDSTDSRELSLPVIPSSPRVKNPEAFIREHKELLYNLGIKDNILVHTQKRKIKFLEKSEEQELNFFTYEPNAEIGTSLKPIVLFSHGGGIGGSYNEKSAYLRVLSSAGLNNSFLVAPDHRGSNSHLEKTRYSLADRGIDLLLALKYSLRKFKDSWNGQIYLFGDSMGRHVSSIVAGILSSKPDLRKNISLILTEPATYVKDADNALWTNLVKGSSNLKNIFNTEEIEGLEEMEVGQILKYNKEDKDSYYIKLDKIDDGEKIFKVSPILSALKDGSSFSEIIQKNKPTNINDSYALEAIDKLDRILLIQMLRDEVVPRNIRELFEKALEGKSKSKIINIPIGHQGTHVEEVRAIVSFVNNEKNRESFYTAFRVSL